MLTAFAAVRQERVVTREADLKGERFSAGCLRDRGTEALEVRIAFNRSDAAKGRKFVSQFPWAIKRVP